MVDKLKIYLGDKAKNYVNQKLKTTASSMFKGQAWAWGNVIKLSPKQLTHSLVRSFF